MAVVVGEAAVRLRPETSRFGSEAEADIDRTMPGTARKAAGYFAAAFAALGAAAFLGNAISEATDLGEAGSKVEVVFGAAAGSVQEFASTASSSLGLSEAAALGATGTFGNLLRATGLAEQAAADMSVGMVGLAGDLASFNNASPEEALDALRAGLVGEAEPLKRFGVNLNAAAIEAKAVELGLAGVGDELTDAAKAQAAYAVIMEQTSLAQGDFARTSAGLANQQRIARAQFADLSADIGGLFVPILGDAAGAITGGLLPSLLETTANLPALGTRLADAAARGREELTILGEIFGEVFVDGQAGVDLLAENSLPGLVANLGQVADTVLRIVGPAFGAIQDAAGPALDQVSASFSAAFGGGGGGGIFTAISGVLQTIGPMIAEYVGRYAEVFAAIIPIVADVLSAILPVIAELLGQIGPILATLLPIVSQVAAIFAQTFVAVLQMLAPILPVIVQAIGQVASMLAGALMSVLQALLPILPPLLEAFAQIALVLAEALINALSAIIPILPTLVQAFLALVQAAILPLLPLLPMLAQLLLTIVTALAPLIPPLLQLVGVIIQLVVAAIVPLLPFLPVLIGLFVQLVGAIMPVITFTLQLVGAFVGMAATVASVVLGFVSTVLGVWTSFYSGLTGIVSRIVGGVVGGFTGLRDSIVGLFSGIAGTVGGFFSGIGGAIRSAINGVISGINNSVISGINVVIRGVNAVNPFDDIPSVPRIPTFHGGGVFSSGLPSGEGLALLRDDELIATPEQRATANDLLRALLDGDAPGGRGGRGDVNVPVTIYQQPGESAPALAARVTSGVVWNLNGGITRPVGAGVSS